MESAAEIEFADVMVRFPTDPGSGRVGMELFPSALRGRLVPRRGSLRGLPFIDALPGDDPWPAAVVESLAQVKIVGAPYPGAFAQGHTMRSSPSANGFRFAGRRTETMRDRTAVVTTLRDGRRHRLEHRLSWHAGDAAAAVMTTFHNDSTAPVTL
ncbi:MAG: hypothetical protein INR62_04815, partial [Rhodospirillales bacterium]|nr:hypothetical protein [Acetobacter sp.]